MTQPASDAVAAPGDGARLTVVAAGGAALAIAAHLLTLAAGPRTHLPVLPGELLFNLALTVLLFACSLVLGRRLLGPLRGCAGEGLQDRLAALGLGLWAITSTVLLAGILHLWYRPLLLLALVVLPCLLRHDLGRLATQTARALAGWRAAGLPTAPERGQRLILALLLVPFVYVLARSMLPLTDWDAVVYHVSAVKLELLQHQLLPLPDLPLANAPSAVEMLYLLGLAAGSDGLGKVLDLGFALLLALAIYGLARRLSGRTPAWYALLFCFSSFWIIAVLPLALTDFAMAFFLVAGVGDGCAWAARLPLAAEAPRRRLLLPRCGLLIGAAAACKLPALAALPALALAVGLVVILHAGGAWPTRLAAAARAGSLVTVAALVPVGPWLLKNWVTFGAPFYPYLGVAVSNPSHGVATDSAAPAASHHLAWIAGSAVDFLVQHVSPLALALPLAVVLLRRPAERFALLFLAAALVCWFLFVPYFDPPRYYLGLDGVAQALSLATIYALPWRTLPRMVLPALLIVLLLAHIWLIPLASLGAMGENAFSGTLSGRLSSFQYRATHSRPYLSEMWVNAHTPADSEIVTVATLTGYYLDRPYLNDWYGRRLGRLESGAAGRAAELADWCRAGVRYAVFDRSSDGMLDFPVTARPRSAFTWTRTPGLASQTLYSAAGIDVLSVRPCAARAGSQ
jgi:hypothetical protein